MIETQDIDDGKSGLGIIQRLSEKKATNAKKNTRKRIQKELPLPYKFMEF